MQVSMRRTVLAFASLGLLSAAPESSDGMSAARQCFVCDMRYCTYYDEHEDWPSIIQTHQGGWFHGICVNLDCAYWGHQPYFLGAGHDVGPESEGDLSIHAVNAVFAAVEARDWEELKFLAQTSPLVSVNAERNAVQVVGFDGATVAHVPLERSRQALVTEE